MMASSESSRDCITHLPPELLTGICGFLSADPRQSPNSTRHMKNPGPHTIIYPPPPTSQADLYNFCLVSKRMQGVAQQVLFRTYNPKCQVEGTAPNATTINSESSPNAYKPDYEGHHPFSSRVLRYHLTFWKAVATKPHFARSVRHATFVLSRHDWWQEDPFSENNSCWTFLEKTRSIEAVNCTSHPLRDRISGAANIFLKDVLPRLRNLQTLTIDAGHTRIYQTFFSLAGLLDVLPQNISHLTLMGDVVSDRRPDEPWDFPSVLFSPEPTLNNITSLHLYPSHIPLRGAGGQLIEKCPKLTDLRLASHVGIISNSYSLAARESICPPHLPALRHLDLTGLQTDNRELFPWLLSDRCFPVTQEFHTLKSLRVSASTWFWFDYEPSNFPEQSRIKQIVPDSLEDLEICFDRPPAWEEHRDTIDSKPVEHMLEDLFTGYNINTAAYPSLERVTFVWWGIPADISYAEAPEESEYSETLKESPSETIEELSWETPSDSSEENKVAYYLPNRLTIECTNI